MISVVQTVIEQSNTTSTAVPIGFVYRSQTGDAIAVVVKWTGQNTIDSVMDNAGNIYFQGPSASIESGSSTISLQIWYCLSINALPSNNVVITVTFSS